MRHAIPDYPFHQLYREDTTFLGYADHISSPCPSTFRRYRLRLRRRTIIIQLLYMRSDSRARSTFSALAAAAVVCARLDMVLRATSSYRCSLPMPTRHARQDGQGFEGCRSSRLPLVSDTNFRLDFLASREPRLLIDSVRCVPENHKTTKSSSLRFRIDKMLRATHSRRSSRSLAPSAAPPPRSACVSTSPLNSSIPQLTRHG
ncbi:hypothetical protein NBRC10512_001141 [Rhodotorula toruloides]